MIHHPLTLISQSSKPSAFWAYSFLGLASWMIFRTNNILLQNPINLKTRFLTGALIDAFVEDVKAGYSVDELVEKYDMKRSTVFKYKRIYGLTQERLKKYHVSEAKFRDLIAQGKTREEIAEALGISVQAVVQRAKRLNLKPAKKIRGRVEEIIKLIKKGLTQQEVARMTGTSLPNVLQVAKRYNLKFPPSPIIGRGSLKIKVAKLRKHGYSPKRIASILNEDEYKILDIYEFTPEMEKAIEEYQRGDLSIFKTAKKHGVSVKKLRNFITNLKPRSRARARPSESRAVKAILMMIDGLSIKEISALTGQSVKTLRKTKMRYGLKLSRKNKFLPWKKKEAWRQIIKRYEAGESVDDLLSAANVKDRKAFKVAIGHARRRLLIEDLVAKRGET